MPSFDAINYAIRPNKTVERKIVFSGLKKLSYAVDLSQHRYIGLGSLWFVDFLMAHKVLGIAAMLSIEQDQIGRKRAEFNRPLSCIEVIPGETQLVIPELDLKSAPSLVWFDYDSGIGGPVTRDIGMLVPRCAANSILIVTISAKRDDLPDKDEAGVEIDPETSLRRIAGDLVPTPLSSKRLRRQDYPKLLCEIVANQFQSATANCGRSESFIKLFDLVYSDGTPMVTVGGILAAPDRADAIQQLVANSGWEGILPNPISIPPLTVKEKMALDRMMPSANPPTDAEMNKIGFQLKRDQIDTFHRHYLHYPQFGELI
jgi:hypothetical protein